LQQHNTTTPPISPITPTSQHTRACSPYERCLDTLPLHRRPVRLAGDCGVRRHRNLGCGARAKESTGSGGHAPIAATGKLSELEETTGLSVGTYVVSADECLGLTPRSATLQADQPAPSLRPSKPGLRRMRLIRRAVRSLTLQWRQKGDIKWQFYETCLDRRISTG